MHASIKAYSFVYLHEITASGKKKKRKMSTLMNDFSLEICWLVLDSLQHYLLTICCFVEIFLMRETIFYVVFSNIFTYNHFSVTSPYALVMNGICTPIILQFLEMASTKDFLKDIQIHLRRDDHRSTLMF